ncbi:MAG: U32 family peptidase [Paludibacteraceae bacterium]|nr:U32 family peptidase [Paludibacteraceae bacterium]
MSHYPLTLLAPARDLEVGKAAIDAGADAVYIGAPHFGARQAAGNTMEDIQSLVQYARPFGVDILVTLNTLLSEEERQEAVEMAWQLYHIGVNALIIQDLRLLTYDLPPLRLHASTQCDNRTSEHIAELEKLGFSRVVLARELSLDEIRTIRQQTTIELEAFVHGALCVSYSGKCYMSERLLGRSANRGCCAQMCRMPYDLLDANHQELLDDFGQPIHQRYLLSLQDLDRSASLKELVEAGITTFKIEGRLKDKDYVTNIVAYYRRLLDKLVPSQRTAHVQYTFTPSPAKTFHRGGIDYFLHGRTPNMANWSTPKSTGEEVGILYPQGSRPNRLRVKLHDGVTLHNGDGLCAGDIGFAINGTERTTNSEVFILPSSRMDIPSTLRPMPLFRNADVTFLRSLHAERRLPVSISFKDTTTGFRLTIGKISHDFEYTHEPANNAERALATIREQLSKVGDTIFYPEQVDIQLSQAFFIPISVLNSWRRQVCKELQTTLSSATTHDITHVKIPQTQLPTMDVTPGTPLMTCRYCLLHEMGHCRKQNPLLKEPKYLRLQNGTMLALHFDCARCEMQLHTCNHS